MLTKIRLSIKQKSGQTLQEFECRTKHPGTKHPMPFFATPYKTSRMDLPPRTKHPMQFLSPRSGENGMGCYVRGDKNSKGCYVRGDKNSMGCFVRGGKSLWDVLSGCQKMAWDVLSRDVLSGSPGFYIHWIWSQLSPVQRVWYVKCQVA